MRPATRGLKEDSRIEPHQLANLKECFADAFIERCGRLGFRVPGE